MIRESGRVIAGVIPLPDTGHSTCACRRCFLETVPVHDYFNMAPLGLFSLDPWVSFACPNPIQKPGCFRGSPWSSPGTLPPVRECHSRRSGQQE